MSTAIILPFRRNPAKHNANSSPEKHSGVVLVHFPIKGEYDVNDVDGHFLMVRYLLRKIFG